MKNTKNEVKFPVLVYRDEIGIEAEISSIRQKREHIAEVIRRSLKDLAFSMEKDTIEVNHFKHDLSIFRKNGAKEYEADLLWGFTVDKDIHPDIKIEKIRELFNVPDFSQRIKDLDFLSKLDPEYFESFFDGETIAAPILTKSEKQDIVEKYSVYINTEPTYRIYLAISSLCDFANILNLETYKSRSDNKISKAGLLQVLPLEFTKMIDSEIGEHGKKKIMKVKYDLFKNK